MANQFLDTNWVSMEVLRMLQNKLHIAQNFNTDWEKDFEQKFPVGSSIQVKLPQRFTIRNGLGYSPQGINRIATTINLDKIFGIDFEWDSYEKAVLMERSEEELKRQYLDPAADQLANHVDELAAQFAYQNTNNIFGTLGSDPTTPDPYLDAERRLYELACPDDERIMCVSPRMQKTIVANSTTLFNPAAEISRQYKKGTMGVAFGWDWYRCNNLYSLTAGTIANTLTVQGANQSGNSLIVQGTNGDTLAVGDVITINNVNQVNPVSRRSPGPLTNKPFVVTQAITLTGGNDTIQISPAIFGPGSQYQNVDALPTNGASCTFWPGTTSPNGKSGTQGLGLSHYAFAIVGAEFESPKRVELCTQMKDPETSLAVRFIRDFDSTRSVMVNRWDMCIGFGVLYPDNAAVRVVGA